MTKVPVERVRSECRPIKAEDTTEYLADTGIVTGSTL